MHILQNTRLTPGMVFITNLLSPASLPFFAAALTIWFVAKKQITKVALIFFGLAGGLLLEFALKIMVGRPRPPFGMIKETDYSFPSGHATLAAVFFLLLIYLFKDSFKNSVLRVLFIFVNVLFCALVGFSRLYLGVHWFSDVIAGYILGVLWFLLLVRVLPKKSKAG